MGKMSFYVLWSLRDVPRQFISKSNRRFFQVHVPLPLPKHLIIFGLGEWKCGEGATISVEVVVSAEVEAQRIGTLTSETRSLVWEGGWRADLATVAAERGRRGVYGKIILAVCGADTGVYSSTPLVQRKRLFPGQHNTTDLCSTMSQNPEDDTITLNSTQLCDSESFAEVQVNKEDTSMSVRDKDSSVWDVEKLPRCTVTTKRGLLTWSSEDMDSLVEDIDQASTPKKTRLCRMTSQEVMLNENRDVLTCPTPRWCHSMCLSDPHTAVLLGGETTDQSFCRDSLWKLKLDSELWFPMNSSTSSPVPVCSRGHTATYDTDSRSVYVYGGLKEGQRYSELSVLNTQTWKWKLINAKGNIPMLAYHSAVFYKKELFIFGGMRPGQSSAEKSCSNALYIFNPEFELWYKPIVEGDRPLPRFGHSATLLSQKLIIFGGQKTATFLNDLHVLDLGVMEYSAVKCVNMAPLPRGFHAALPVADNRIVVSGGRSSIGVLRDVHIFNIDTNTWSAVQCPALCSRPCAGHSMMTLGCTTLADKENQESCNKTRVYCTVLVFGGSDCSGTFYNDIIKCTISVPEEH